MSTFATIAVFLQYLNHDNEIPSLWFVCETQIVPMEKGSFCRLSTQTIIK